MNTFENNRKGIKEDFQYIHSRYVTNGHVEELQKKTTFNSSQALQLLST